MSVNLVAQLIINGLVSGAGLAALGFATYLIIGVTRRFHFAFALTYTLAAYGAAVTTTELGLSPWLGVFIGVAAAGLAGGLIEFLVYRPLAKKGGDDALLAIFVSSLGLTIGGISAIQLLWSRTRLSTPFNLLDVEAVQLPFGLRITNLDLIYMLASLILAIGAAIYLNRSLPGQIVRGVRGNPVMARSVGIRPEAVSLWLFVTVSAGTGVIAVLDAARVSATPTMGYDPLFSSFVVCFVAGTSAPFWRVIVIGIGLGLLTSLSGIWVPVSLTNIVIFTVLFLYLTFKGLSVLARFGIPAKVRKA